MTSDEMHVVGRTIGGTAVAELDGTWWWCLQHARAEEYSQTDSPERLGPFSTQDEAAHALKTIADREEAYAREEEDGG